MRNCFTSTAVARTCCCVCRDCEPLPCFTSCWDIDSHGPEASQMLMREFLPPMGNGWARCSRRSSISTPSPSIRFLWWVACSSPGPRYNILNGKLQLHSADSFNFNIFTQSVQWHVQHPENVFASLFAHHSRAGNSNSNYCINIEVFRRWTVFQLRYDCCAHFAVWSVLVGGAAAHSELLQPYGSCNEMNWRFVVIMLNAFFILQCLQASWYLSADFQLVIWNDICSLQIFHFRVA